MVERRTKEKVYKKVTFNDECDWLLNMKIDRGVNSDGRHWVQLSQSLAIEKIAECMGLLEKKDKFHHVLKE